MNDKILDHLFYCSYAANRLAGMSQASLESLFGRELDIFEKKFQMDGGNTQTLEVTL